MNLPSHLILVSETMISTVIVLKSKAKAFWKSSCSEKHTAETRIILSTGVIYQAKWCLDRKKVAGTESPTSWC